MWHYLEEHFAGQRAKLRVVTLMLRLGLRVDRRGRIFCGAIELPPAKFARAVDVDRRVVIGTAREIAGKPSLFEVFSRLEPTNNVSAAARHLGNDVIEIDADPNTVGLVGKVSGILSRHNVGIRQIIADDPDLYPEPKMRLVIEGRIPRNAADELRALRVQAISFK